MSLYTDYLDEIGTREAQGLNPKPIDDGALVAELIEQIKDTGNAHREDSLKFFIYASNSSQALSIANCSISSIVAHPS